MSSLLLDNQRSGLPDYDEWLKLRMERSLACLQDRRLQEVEKQICKNDIVHFVRYWGWIFAPWNPPELQEMLFIPYQFQEELMLEFVEGMKTVTDPHSFKRVTLVIEKARDMAASWTSGITALWDWLFHNGTHIFVSRKEEAVDKRGDMKSIFQKIRFFLYHLPEWFLPVGFNKRKHDTHMLLQNPQGGEISGEATTGNSSRSGRAKVVWFDEFAFVQRGLDDAAWTASSQTAKMRVAISTPNGKHNRFYRLVRPVDEEDEEGQKVISLPWHFHPVKAQNARVENGKIVSPWYIESKRTMDKQTFAKEVEIDYNLSVKGWIFEGYDWQHKDRKLQPERGRRIIVGLDPGVHFAATWGQIDSFGRILFLKEKHWDEAKLDVIAREILDINARYFHGFSVDYYGDPAGAHRTVSNQARSEYLELYLTHKINVEYNFMNRIATEMREETRIKAIENKMFKECHALGTPMLMINPDQCKYLDQAFAGDYRRKISITGEVLDQTDRLHPWADAADTAGYILLGAGEGAGQGNSRRAGAELGPPERRLKSVSKAIKWRMIG